MADEPKGPTESEKKKRTPEEKAARVATKEKRAVRTANREKRATNIDAMTPEEKTAKAQKQTARREAKGGEA